MILKALEKMEHADKVEKVYQLFPTVMKMKDSPNGRKLRFLFQDGAEKYYSKIASFATKLPSPIIYGNRGKFLLFSFLEKIFLAFG